MFDVLNERAIRHTWWQFRAPVSWKDTCTCIQTQDNTCMRKGSSLIPASKEGQSIWLKCRQGFQPCFEAGTRELPFLMHEPAEKPSLHSYLRERYGSSTQKLVREHERSLHNTCMHTYIHTHLHTRTHVHTCTRARTHTYKHAHTYKHTYIHTTLQALTSTQPCSRPSPPRYQFE